MRWRIAQAGLVGLLAVATGCLMPRTESRPVHTYQLSPDSERAEIEARQVGSGAIVFVSLPQSDPGFDTQRMAYVTRPYEISYFSANQWADTPGRMLSPLLVKALEQTGVWQAVITAPGVVRADYRLDVSGLALAQEFLQSPSRVRLSWRAQLIDLREGHTLGTRRFEAAKDASSEDAYGSVRAANQVLGKLLSEMASWLGSCVSQRGKAAC